MKPMTDSIVKVVYYADREWHTIKYLTSNPRWREAYLILQQTYDRVRILY